MPVSDLSRVISTAVVPVVIISACGLLCLAFYNRLAAIVSRLRTFQRERLIYLERIQKGSPPHSQKLLDHLELQTIRVKHRANLIRLTLLFFLLTIGLLVICCLTLGLAVVYPQAIFGAVVIFITALLCMLCGTIAAALELKGSLEPVELESQFVSEVVEEISEVLEEQSPRDANTV